jgi:hypothetical protein
MRELTNAVENIQRALKCLDSKKLKTPSDDKEMIQTLARAQEFNGIPTFIRNGDTIQTVNPETFDYSVLGESIGAFCIGLDQMLVGKDLAKLNHQVFETLALYSAAYQFLDSILSIRGIHFIYKPLAPFVVTKEFKDVYGKRKEIFESKRKYFELPVIVGETDGVNWLFTKSSLSHDVRWQKFGELLIWLIDHGKATDIPNDVKRLYAYLKAIDDYKKHRLEQMEFKIEFSGDGAFKSAIGSYTGKIASIRHEAVYQNRAYDVFAYAAMRAGEGTASFIEARISFVSSFTITLARWSAEMISQIWKALKEMRPYPDGAVDWLALACEYIPLKMKLEQVRLEKIYNRTDLMSIQSSISEILLDIMGSLGDEREVVPRRGTYQNL